MRETRYCHACGVRQIDIPGHRNDNRASWWLVRLRIYRANTDTDPIADSEPDARPESLGTVRIRGLRNALSWVAHSAAEVHGTYELSGLGPEVLDQKEKSIRPTLSRHKVASGKSYGTIRLLYDTVDTFNERTQKRGWVARLDLEQTE